MIKPEKNITGKKDSRYGAMENVSIKSLYPGENKKLQDDKTATMPIDMLSHIYWVCSRFFWGEIMLSFALC